MCLCLPSQEDIEDQIIELLQFVRSGKWLTTVHKLLRFRVNRSFISNFIVYLPAIICKLQARRPSQAQNSGLARLLSEPELRVLGSSWSREKLLQFFMYSCWLPGFVRCLRGEMLDGLDAGPTKFAIWARAWLLRKQIITFSGSGFIVSLLMIVLNGYVKLWVK